MYVIRRKHISPTYAAGSVQRPIEIHSFRVLSSPDRETATGWGQVLGAIRIASELQCEVINISLGIEYDTTVAKSVFGPTGPFRATLSELRRSNGSIPLMCCAVGNDGEAAPALWPASLGHSTDPEVEPIPEIIAVGAHNEFYKTYKYNQRGAKVLALGVNLRSRENGEWINRTGSSQATAVVSAFHAFFDHQNRILTMLHPTRPLPLLHCYHPPPTPAQPAAPPAAAKPAAKPVAKPAAQPAIKLAAKGAASPAASARKRRAAPAVVRGKKPRTAAANE